MPRPSRTIQQHTYSIQMAEPRFKTQSFLCLGKYCNHSGTEADPDFQQTRSSVWQLGVGTSKPLIHLCRDSEIVCGNCFTGCFVFFLALGRTLYDVEGLRN